MIAPAQGRGVSTVQTLQTFIHFSQVMSQVIVVMYFLLVSIITINIYIALLSEAFARVNETASEKAYLEQARFIQNIEMIMPEYFRKFEVYLNTHCSPKVILLGFICTRILFLVDLISQIANLTFLELKKVSQIF